MLRRIVIIIIIMVESKKIAENMKNENEIDFDPSSAPPFRIAEIRAAIPDHCWVKDPWRSMTYVVRDIVIVAGLFILADVYFNRFMFLWPIYWIAQGTMFWAIFVLGHDW